MPQNSLLRNALSGTKGAAYAKTLGKLKPSKGSGVVSDREIKLKKTKPVNRGLGAISDREKAMRDAMQ